MAIKGLALIEERDRRKKKKEKELVQLKSPEKKETATVKKTVNNKGTTYTDRSTISTKPTVQNTTQNRVVTNKDRLSNKSTFGGINTDIRTVKTQNKPKYSKETADIYERGGRYYYKDGKKEKEIDRAFVEDAIKNKRTGVIGNYDSKGTLRTTDEKGNVKEQSLLNKAGYLGKTAKTRAKKGAYSIVDAVLQETTNDLQKGEKIDNYGDLAKNEIKALIHAMSPALGRNAANKEAGKNIRKIWKDKDKTLWQKIVGTGLETANAGTFGDIQSLKESVRSLGAIDHSADEKVAKIQQNLDAPVNKEIEQLEQEKYNYGNGMRRAAEAVGVTANMAAPIAVSAITKNPKLGMLAASASAKGQATERALQSGADLDTSVKYGTAIGDIEYVLEGLSSGLKIFGKGPKGNWVKKTASSLDKAIENAINAKIKSKSINFGAKSLVGILGEDVEEILSDIFGTAVDRGSIDPNAKYTLKDAKDTILNTTFSTLLTNASTGGYGRGAYNQNINDMQNFQTKQSQQAEVIEQVNNGAIDKTEANQKFEQIENGTYEQNKNLDQIATQQRDAIVQAVQTGQLSQVEATQEMEALDKTLTSERERINTPQEETEPRNVGKHYGDLGKAQDTYYSEVSKSRGTGHFGTGTYFVSEDYEPGGSSSYSKRPSNVVSFDNYNLYKPSTDQDGYDLHDGLKAINSKSLFNKEEISKIQKQYNNYKTNLSDESINNLINVLDENGYDVENIKKDLEEGWTTRAETNLVDMAEDILDDYDSLYKSYNKMIEQIKKNNPNISDEIINNAFEATNKTLEEYKEKGYKYGQYPTPKIDSLSTIFMKNLGYEGIDVRHLKGLNDTTYGSVIYDLKNNNQRTKSISEKLEGFTQQQKESITRGENNFIVENKESLRNQTIEALQNQNSKKNLYLGVLSNTTIQNIQERVENISSESKNNLFDKTKEYQLAINQDEIRHLAKKEGLTEKDVINFIDSLDELIVDFDSVSYHKYNGNQNALRFKKQMSDGTHIAFEVLSKQKGTMRTQTLFLDKADFIANKKRSISPTSNELNSSLDKTSKTNGGLTPSMDNIQQNNQNVNSGPEILDTMPVEKTTTIKSLKKGLNKFREEITDTFAPIYDLAYKKTGNKNLYYKVDRILSSDGRAQVDLDANQVDLNGKPYKNFTDEQGNKVAMGFETAFDLYKDIPVKDKNTFLVHQLNIDRWNQGVDQFGIPIQESEQKLEELRNKYEKIDNWSENIYQYYRNLGQKMVDNGRVSQEQMNKWWEGTPHYVHIQRQVNNQGNTGVSVKNGKVDSDNLIRKVKGGDYAILPIKETTAKFTQNASRAFAFNDFGKEYARTIGTDARGGNVSADTDIDEIFGFEPEFVNSDGKGTYTMKIYEKGVPVEIPISEDIYNSLSPKTIPRVGVLAEATNVYKDLLTNKNPFFGFLRNPIKDVGDMFLYSKHPLHKSIATYNKLFGGRTALRNRVITKDGVTAQDIVDYYHNTGNAVHSIFRNGQFESNKSNIKKKVDKTLSPLEKGNDFMESMPRITEFWNTIESEGYTLKDGELVPQKGKTPKKTVEEVIAEAGFYAADVTVNFKRGGRTSKAISQNGGIFFNPSVQGASKFVRNITEAVGDAKSGDFQAAKRLVARAAMLGVAPAILSAVMYGDDDEYKEIQDYQKDQYYLIKNGDGKWIRIPKGRAISLVESAARRTIDTVKGDKDAFKGYGQLVKNQIAPNNPLDNNIFSPLTAAATNKSWSGNKIVNDSMSKRPKAEQFNEKTDEFSKWIGKQLNISPMKVNYVIDQYSGVLGDLILPQITPKSTTGSSNPVTNILRDNFSFDAANSSKNVGEFYDMKREANTKAYSIKHTEKDKLKSQFMNTKSKEMYDLYSKKQEIQMDKGLSKKEKYKQALEVQKEINKFAKEATQEAENISVDKNTATVGSTQYYKKSNGDWAKESEKTKEKREDLGLSAKEYYHLKNDESYTQPNGYKKYITSGENAKRNMAIVDAFNFDTSDYLEYTYKISKIQGNKNSKGKTIKGTRQPKVIEYINSLPISSTQKAYLYKTQYSSYRSQDKTLANEINKSNLSKEEKEQIYSYLGLGR